MKVLFFLSFLILNYSKFSLSQINDSIYYHDIDLSDKSYSQLCKLVRKGLNSDIDFLAEKWTQIIPSLNRNSAKDTIKEDLMLLSKDYLVLYMSASSAFLVKNGILFKDNDDFKRFNFDPSQEVKKDYKMIGEFLLEIQNAYKEYLIDGKRGIDSFYKDDYYVVNGRKKQNGRAITKRYASEFIKRWELLY